MTDSGNVVRQTVHFSGTVQGVGFRFTTRQIAQGFDVVGRVRNLRDGRVELVAEAPEPEIDRFLAAIRERMGGYISDAHTTSLSATGEFTSFEIAF